MSEARSARLGNRSRSTPQLRPLSTNSAKVHVNGNSEGDWTARFLPRIRPLEKSSTFNPQNELDFSPRGLEAMRRLGYKRTDILPRRPEEFDGPNEKMALLRYNFWENQRRGSLLDVRQLRNKLIRQNWNDNTGPSPKQIEREIERKNALLTHRSQRIRKRVLSRKVQSEVSDIYKEQLAEKQQIESAAALRRRELKMRDERKKIRKRNQEQTCRFRENWQAAEHEKTVRRKTLMMKIESNIHKQDELMAKRVERQLANRGASSEKRAEVNARLSKMERERKSWEESQIRHQTEKLEESEKRLLGMKEQMVFAYRQKLMSRRQKAEENLGKRHDNTAKVMEKLEGKEEESQQRLRRLEADRKRKVEKQRKAELYRKDKIRELRQRQLERKNSHIRSLQEKHRKQEETKRMIEQQKEEERMLKNELNRLKDQRRKQLSRKRARSRTYMQDLAQKRIDSEAERFNTIQRVKKRVVQQRRDYNTKSQLLREEVTDKLSHAPTDILKPKKMSKFLGQDILNTIEDPLSPIKKKATRED